MSARDNTLDKELYPTVKEAMLSKTPTQLARSSGARSLRARSFATPIFADIKTVDMSFARQMFDVRQDYERLTNGETKTAPDVFLLTHRSAVPVADAIRGYYDALGQPVPHLDYVIAPRHLNREAGLQLVADEAARLRPIVENAEHVCIVDQWVATGRTLKHARHIVDEAAAHEVPGTVMRGVWYGQADGIGPLSLENMTSRHARFMHEIGHLAAQQFEL